MARQDAALLPMLRRTRTTRGKMVEAMPVTRLDAATKTVDLVIDVVER